MYLNVENQIVEARLVDLLSSIFRLVDTDDRRETTKIDLMTYHQDGFGDDIVIAETAGTTRNDDLLRRRI